MDSTSTTSSRVFESSDLPKLAAGCPYHQPSSADNGGEGAVDPLSDLDRRQQPHPEQQYPLPTVRLTSSIPRSHQPVKKDEDTHTLNNQPTNDGSHLSSSTLPSSSSSSSSCPSSSSSSSPPSSCPMDPNAPLKGSHQPPGAEHWVYPSPQMFFNAMKRKGHAPSEADMATVVMIHNTVNEQVWHEILQWERLHCAECGTPKLKSFSGHFHKLSPRARLRMLGGHKRPFDRHDWVVDRCGKDVRYVIDFYESPPEPGKQIGIHLDVRPALDSLQAFYDRLAIFSGLTSLQNHERQSQ